MITFSNFTIDRNRQVQDVLAELESPDKEVIERQITRLSVPVRGLGELGAAEILAVLGLWMVQQDERDQRRLLEQQGEL